MATIPVDPLEDAKLQQMDVLLHFPYRFATTLAWNLCCNLHISTDAFKKLSKAGLYTPQAQALFWYNSYKNCTTPQQFTLTQSQILEFRKKCSDTIYNYFDAFLEYAQAYFIEKQPQVRRDYLKNKIMVAYSTFTDAICAILAINLDSTWFVQKADAKIQTFTQENRLPPNWIHKGEQKGLIQILKEQMTKFPPNEDKIIADYKILQQPVIRDIGVDRTIAAAAAAADDIEKGDDYDDNNDDDDDNNVNQHSSKKYRRGSDYSSRNNYWGWNNLSHHHHHPHDSTRERRTETDDNQQDFNSQIEYSKGQSYQDPLRREHPQRQGYQRSQLLPEHQKTRKVPIHPEDMMNLLQKRKRNHKAEEMVNESKLWKDTYIQSDKPWGEWNTFHDADYCMNLDQQRQNTIINDSKTVVDKYINRSKKFVSKDGKAPRSQLKQKDDTVHESVWDLGFGQFDAMAKGLYVEHANNPGIRNYTQKYISEAIANTEGKDYEEKKTNVENATQSIIQTESVKWWVENIRSSPNKQFQKPHPKPKTEYVDLTDFLKKMKLEDMQRYIATTWEDLVNSIFTFHISVIDNNTLIKALHHIWNDTIFIHTTTFRLFSPLALNSKRTGFLQITKKTMATRMTFSGYPDALKNFIGNSFSVIILLLKLGRTESLLYSQWTKNCVTREISNLFKKVKKYGSFGPDKPKRDKYKQEYIQKCLEKKNKRIQDDQKKLSNSLDIWTEEQRKLLFEADSTGKYNITPGLAYYYQEMKNGPQKDRWEYATTKLANPDSIKMSVDPIIKDRINKIESVTENDNLNLWNESLTHEGITVSDYLKASHPQNLKYIQDSLQPSIFLSRSDATFNINNIGKSKRPMKYIPNLIHAVQGPNQWEVNVNLRSNHDRTREDEDHKFNDIVLNKTDGIHSSSGKDDRSRDGSEHQINYNYDHNTSMPMEILPNMPPSIQRNTVGEKGPGMKNNNNNHTPNAGDKEMYDESPYIQNRLPQPSVTTPASEARRQLSNMRFSDNDGGERVGVGEGEGEGEGEGYKRPDISVKKVISKTGSKSKLNRKGVMSNMSIKKRTSPQDALDESLSDIERRGISHFSGPDINKNDDHDDNEVIEEDEEEHKYEPQSDENSGQPQQ